MKYTGDIGDIKIIDQLKEISIVRAVFGNIDNHIIRSEFNEDVVHKYGRNKLLMTHIGGKPYKYNNKTKLKLITHQPQIFICGHSHICKIMHDEINKILYINPGQQEQRIPQNKNDCRFELSLEKITNLEVIELEKDNYLNLSKDLTRSSSFLIDLLAKNKRNDETNKKNPIW